MPTDRLSSGDVPIIYSNSFTLTAGDNDFSLRFMVEVPDGEERALLDQATVILTPRLAKILMMQLISGVQSIEAHLGAPIPLPPGFEVMAQPMPQASEAQKGK